MVLGLLTLAAIPTTIGVAEGVSSTRKTSDNDSSDPTTTSTTEADRMRKFHLRIYCDVPSSKASQIHSKLVHLRDDRLFVHAPKPTAPSSSPFLGFYVPYPDPSRRPHPSPLGLVSFIASKPPTLNWIYVDTSTRELRYGNRTTSISHIVGPWAWDTGDSEDSDDDADGGGLVLNGEERAIAIETEDGVWQLFWELGNGEEGGRGIPEMKGKRKLRVSLDRVFVEGKEEAGKGVKKEGAAEDKEKKVGRVEGGVEVRSQQGGKREGRATEATLEVRTKTREGKEVKGEESGKGKREEKKKYEFKG